MHILIRSSIIYSFNNLLRFTPFLQSGTRIDVHSSKQFCFRFISFRSKHSCSWLGREIRHPTANNLARISRIQRTTGRPNLRPASEQSFGTEQRRGIRLHDQFRIRPHDTDQRRGFSPRSVSAVIALGEMERYMASDYVYCHSFFFTLLPILTHHQSHDLAHFILNVCFTVA